MPQAAPDEDRLGGQAAQAGTQGARGDDGPTGGDLSDVKRLDTVVAGTDQVAVDSFGATLFGMKGSDIGSVRLAANAGLGVMDLSKLQIKKIGV